MRKLHKRNTMRAIAALSISAITIVPILATGWQHNMTGWWYGTNEMNTTSQSAITLIRTAICSPQQLRRMVLL